MVSLLNIFGKFVQGTGGAEPTYVVNYFVTMALAAVVIFSGQAIVKKSKFLTKAALPAPVVSGLIFAIIIGFIRVYVMKVDFDAKIMKDFAQNIFFCGVGFAFSVNMLKKAGRKLVINIALGAVLIITFQDTLGLGLSKLIDMHPLLALQCSSAAMSGGVATASAMGVFYESLGVPDATVVGVAAGTFGNIVASLVGGPVGAFLVRKHNLKSDPNDKPKVSDENVFPLSYQGILKALCWMCCMAFLARPLTAAFKLINIEMPVAITCIFAGLIVRVIADMSGKKLPLEEIDVMSNQWLQFYLALIMLTVDFTKLAPLAGQMSIILILQVVLMILFAIFISFPLFGKDYAAAVMAAGNCGWSLGSATNCVANEKAMMEAYGWSTVAWELYPAWSIVWDDLYNPVVLSILGSIFMAGW